MQIQRCLSHAYKRSMQVTGGIPEGNATLIDNIYAEPACSDKWKEVGLPGRAALRVSCVRSAWLLALPLLLFAAGTYLLLCLSLSPGVPVELD